MALCAVFYYAFREEKPRETNKLYTIGQPIVSNKKARNALRNRLPQFEYFVGFFHFLCETVPSMRNINPSLPRRE